MSKAPYIVDNEKYHGQIATQIRLARKGFISVASVLPADGLERRAASAYAEHLKMPASKRPRFPSTVTSDSLFHYRHEALKRGLI